jgi:hypothetical protein
MAIPQRLEPGKRLADDDALNTALATPQWQTNTGITALAGGSRTGAPVLVLGSNEVTTVASGADSVVLPVAVPGSVVFVVNATASTSMQVFANGSDTINGTAGATGVAQAGSKSALYVAADLGQWYRILSA